MIAYSILYPHRELHVRDVGDNFIVHRDAEVSTSLRILRQIHGSHPENWGTLVGDFVPAYVARYLVARHAAYTHTRGRINLKSERPPIEWLRGTWGTIVRRNNARWFERAVRRVVAIALAWKREQLAELI